MLACATLQLVNKIPAAALNAEHPNRVNLFLRELSDLHCDTDTYVFLTHAPTTLV